MTKLKLEHYIRTSSDDTLTIDPSGPIVLNSDVNIEGNELRLENANAIDLYLVADTGNTNENNVPTIHFGADGTDSVARLGLLPDNSFEIWSGFGRDIVTYTNNAEALRIKAADQSVTFASDVTVSDQLFLPDTTSSFPVLSDTGVVYHNGAIGLVLAGIGSSADLTLLNRNGAAYMRGIAATQSVIFDGKLTVDGGAKISVQNKVNGGSGQGIFLWDTDDTSWGIYMGTSGGNRSFNNGAACTSLTGETNHHFRLRVPNAATNGFLWENSSEQCLMSLTADTGDLYTLGNIFCGGGFIAAINGGMTGQTSAGSVGVAGGAGLSVGGNVVFYAQGHASQANDILFRSGTTDILRWDDSVSRWDFKSNKIAGVTRLERSSSTGILHMSGGTDVFNGGNIVMYSENHATRAGDLSFRSNSNERLAWDESQTRWEFKGTSLYDVNDITTTGLLTADRYGASNAGSAAMPVFYAGSDTNSGMYNISNNVLGFSTAGVEAIRIDANQDVILASSLNVGNELRVPQGSVTDPSISFEPYSNSGIYMIGTTAMGFTTGGVLRMTVANAEIAATVPLNMNSNDITGVDSIIMSNVAGVFRNSTASSTYFSGGDAIDNGGNLRAYGGSHGIKPNYIELRAGASVALEYNGTDAFDFQGNDITTTGTVKAEGMFSLGTPTEVTINAGAITITKSFHTVDTEADAVTDELRTINGGSDGDLLIIKSVTASRDVVVKDDDVTGNLRLAGDFTLTAQSDRLMLQSDGGYWYEISRSNNA